MTIWYEVKLNPLNGIHNLNYYYTWSGIFSTTSQIIFHLSAQNLATTAT